MTLEEAKKKYEGKLVESTEGKFRVIVVTTVVSPTSESIGTLLAPMGSGAIPINVSLEDLEKKFHVIKS